MYYRAITAQTVQLENNNNNNNRTTKSEIVNIASMIFFIATTIVEVRLFT